MILLTRPLEDSLATARKIGTPCMIEPMLEIKKLNLNINNGGEVFVLTSKNAAHALPKNAEIVSIPQHGKNAEEILQYVLKNIPKNKKIIYLRGDKITLNISAKLRTAGFHAKDIIAYHTIYAEKFSAGFLEKLGAIKIAVFFSSASAKVFQELAKGQDLSQIIFLGISKKVCEQARGWKEIICADEPNEESIIQKLRHPSI